MANDTSAGNKPENVKIAIILLWMTLAIGAVKGIPVVPHYAAVAPLGLGFVITTMVIVFAFIAWLIWKISAGRAWARNTFCVLCILGILPTILHILLDMARSPIIGGLDLVQMLMQLFAVYLVCTKPGSDWFRKPVLSGEQ